jgi:hypothetical protein
VCRLAVIAFILLSVITPVCAAEDAIPELELIQALPCDGPDWFEPSGLTFRDGVLYTVSDKHDDTIFRLEPGANSVKVTPDVQFPVANLPAAGNLDFEGITVDSDGNFLLVSETEFRVARVKADGSDAQWITDSLEQTGRQAGLFETDNAYLEGIASPSPGVLLLCAERQPSGIVTVNLNANPPEVAALKFYPSSFPIRPGRTSDLTDLYFENGKSYALQRNGEGICLLMISEFGPQDTALWSFKTAVRKSESAYRDSFFGMAEGLVMNKERIYIIVDNNGTPSREKPDDFRPLLFVFRRPL